MLSVSYFFAIKKWYKGGKVRKVSNVEPTFLFSYNYIYYYKIAHLGGFARGKSKLSGPEGQIAKAS